MRVLTFVRFQSRSYFKLSYTFQLQWQLYNFKRNFPTCRFFQLLFSTSWKIQFTIFYAVLLRYGNDLLCIRTIRFNFLWPFLFSHFTSEDLKLKVIRYSRLNWILWFIDYDLIRTLGVVLSCVLNFFSPDSVSIVSCTSRCVMVFFTVVTWKFKIYFAGPLPLKRTSVSPYSKFWTAVSTCSSRLILCFTSRLYVSWPV